MNKTKGQVDVLFTVGIVLSAIVGIMMFIPRVSYLPYTSEKYASTQNVQIFNEPPKENFVEIGEIKVKKGLTTEEGSLQRLINKAKEVGADGVIIKNRYENEVIAVAIKFKK